MYQYLRFRSDYDGSEVTLPRALADDKLVTGELIQPYVDTIGGVGAWRTDDIADVTQRKITLQGSYVGRDGMLQDGGEALLDGTEPLLSGSGKTVVTALWQGLVAMRGHQGRLYREWIDGGDEQWALATLMRANSNVRPVNWIANKIDVRTEFTLPGGVWIGAAQTQNITVGSGTDYQRPRLRNNGNVESNTLTLILTPSSSSTSAEIALSYGDVDWRWSGAVTASQPLTIDCAAQTVEEATALGTVSRIGGFDTNEFHRSPGWAPIAPGIQQLGFILTNLEGDLDLEWYDTFV